MQLTTSRFQQLGSDFFTALPPTPLADPYWVGRSHRLAAEVGLDAQWLQSAEALECLSGNRLLPGSQPLATVYSGHQFGVWAGQLGDGRAILLGDAGNGHEVQIKGGGRTPYSRRGDGRAVLRSSIREFLASEAMHALGIPTTRALCVTGSPATVWREDKETAAVVTRMAPSFIRFGHFEHFAAQGHTEALRRLADFVIDNFYPSCRDSSALQGNPYAALLQAVSERTAAMVAHWQAVGFCHGVMNTDNMSILGLTIDYGPYQFLDTFDPGHICNHSDTQGRYAFNRQPDVAYWNLHCLAQALLPLLDSTDQARAALASYREVFPAEFMARMRDKLGLITPQPGDGALVDGVLQLLANQRVDYTIFWRRLSHAVGSGDFGPVRDLFIQTDGWERWLLLYSERLRQAPPAQTAKMADLMLSSNPKFVLRNHLAEIAIQSAKLGDTSALETLQTLLEAPFDEHPAYEAHADFPPDWASSISISCSS